MQDKRRRLARDQAQSALTGPGQEVHEQRRASASGARAAPRAENRPGFRPPLGLADVHGELPVARQLWDATHEWITHPSNRPSVLEDLEADDRNKCLVANLRKKFRPQQVLVAWQAQ